jgi:uncharacterized protein
MALGLFIALLPILGLQLPLALLITELLRRLAHLHLSRVATVAGVWLTNPLTMAPLYGLCYLVGRPLAQRLLPAAPQPVSSGGASLDLAALSGPEALSVGLSLVLGAVLLGVPIAWVGYRITYSMASRQLARRLERRARRLRPDALVTGT